MKVCGKGGKGGVKVGVRGRCEDEGEGVRVRGGGGSVRVRDDGKVKGEG